jgi:hypothetical protein
LIRIIEFSTPPVFDEELDLMSLTSRGFLSASAAALAVSCLMLTGAAQAASISYPDQGPIPPGYMFTNIVESSATDGVPLYGMPTAFPIGLNFTPTGFAASSIGGGADLTDGQLNYTVMAGPNAPGIPLIALQEGGTFSLVGPGSSATQVLAGAIIRASVHEINGVPIAPINLTPVNGSVAFDLNANPGVAQPWGLGLTLNVSAQLAGLGFAPTQRATKVDVVIDNALVALSEGGRFSSTALITKGDFDVNITPEPGSCLLMGMALCALALGRGVVGRN